jgi:hypothetical protein
MSDDPTKPTLPSRPPLNASAQLLDPSMNPVLAKNLLLTPFLNNQDKPLHTIETMGGYVWLYLQLKKNVAIGPLLIQDDLLREISARYERYAFAFHLFVSDKVPHFVKPTNDPRFASTNYSETHYVCMVCQQLVGREVANQGPSLERMMRQIERHVEEQHSV